MKREPEPELMTTSKQVKAYSEADFSVGENAFIDFISTYLQKRQISLSKDDLIVDLGCGPGNISEKLANKWQDVSVLGIDGSKEMIIAAESKNSINSQLSNLSYQCADIKALKREELFIKKRLRLLVSNSLIHHINNINDFFECINYLSLKETINFHKDLIRPKNKEIAFKLKQECSLSYDETLVNDYYASLKASYTKHELNQIMSEKNLDQMDVIEDGQKYLIVYGRVKL